MTSQQAADLWGITERQVQSLCHNGKIKDVLKHGRAWLIPKDAIRPIDGRTKAARQEKENDK